MKAGKIGALITYDTNPAYTLPKGAEFAEVMKKVGLTVAFSMTANETAGASQYVVATPHYLESWGDVMIKMGQHSLVQPTINKLFDTRQFQETLMKWTNMPGTYYDYLKGRWTGSLLGGKSWNRTLHDGTFRVALPE